MFKHLPKEIFHGVWIWALIGGIIGFLSIALIGIGMGVPIENPFINFLLLVLISPTMVVGTVVALLLGPIGNIPNGIFFVALFSQVLTFTLVAACLKGLINKRRLNRQ